MSHFAAIKFPSIKSGLLGLVCVTLAFPAMAQDPTAPPLLPGMSGPADGGAPAEEEVENEGAPPTDVLPDGPDAAFGLEGAEDFNFEKSSESLEEEARREAFDAALQGLLPLRPEEIRELLEHFDRTQESVELPVYPAPKPEVIVETLALDPGTKPTVIKTAYGYVTTVNFLDSTGAPFPLQNITWAGNFDVIEVEVEEDKFTNTLTITPQSEYAYGNMSVHLVGLNTPIIISLETSRDVVHYRFDAITPQPGPLASIPIIAEGVGLAAGDADLSSVLEGAPPSRAVKMAVSGVDNRTSAYRFNGLTYIRTPLTLLSPAWITSASSADGMHVYAMGHAPVLLLSEKGKLVRARLSDREETTDE